MVHQLGIEVRKLILVSAVLGYVQLTWSQRKFPSPAERKIKVIKIKAECCNFLSFSFCKKALKVRSSKSFSILSLRTLRFRTLNFLGTLMTPGTNYSKVLNIERLYSASSQYRGWIFRISANITVPEKEKVWEAEADTN